MTEDDREDARASYDRVVESLDAVVRRHPAGSARRDRAESAPNPTAKPLPDNVVDLRARRAPVRSGAGFPDDAA